MKSNEKQQIKQILIGAKALIQKGWTRGSFFNDGRYCLDGALMQAGGSDVRGDMVKHGSIDENRILAKAEGYLYSVLNNYQTSMSIISFNDQQKTKKPVLDLLTKAIERLENEER